MKKYKFIFLLSLTLVLFAAARTVSAHVIVTPSQVAIGKFQTFSVGVPAEKDSPTVALRLLLPAGLQEVYPSVKPGWKITVKKNGTGDAAEVSEIDWIDGSIPTGQRDDFTFSAQVPAAVTTLQWKAYQTYQDGSVISWDQDPKVVGDDDNGSAGPYSQTEVVNDLSPSAASSTMPLEDARLRLTFGISLAALALSIVVLVTKKK